jgi:hypothetical protein
VLLPGFQKSRDIKASQGKGQGAVLAKKAICVVQGKTDRIALLFGSIKCFPLSLTHLRHFRWLPDGAGIINYQ